MSLKGRRRERGVEKGVKEKMNMFAIFLPVVKDIY